jgi:hypothetical protein
MMTGPKPTAIALLVLLASGLESQGRQTADNTTPVNTPVTAQQPRHEASFEGLGDLPGGDFESLGLRVSGDGAVVVGNSATASGKQAFP